MKAPRLALTSILGLGLLAAPLASVAQPALENFRFDPPRVCARDTLRWGVSYRGLPGGLPETVAADPRERPTPALHC